VSKIGQGLGDRTTHTQTHTVDVLFLFMKRDSFKGKGKTQSAILVSNLLRRHINRYVNRLAHTTTKFLD